MGGGGAADGEDGGGKGAVAGGGDRRAVGGCFWAIGAHAVAAVNSPTPRIPNMIRSAFVEIMAEYRLRPLLRTSTKRSVIMLFRHAAVKMKPRHNETYPGASSPSAVPLANPRRDRLYCLRAEYGTTF